MIRIIKILWYCRHLKNGQWWAANKLAWLGDTRAVSPLIEALRARNYKVRNAAA